MALNFNSNEVSSVYFNVNEVEEVQYNGDTVYIKSSPITYIYNEGDECTSLTGGWQSSENIQVVPWHSWSPYGHTYFRKNTSDFEVGCEYTGDISSLAAGALTINSIDLTNYNTLKINCLEAYRRDSDSWYGVYVSQTPLIGDISIVPIVGENSIDISSLTGLYYIIVVAVEENRSDVKVKINKIWLE